MASSEICSDNYGFKQCDTVQHDLTLYRVVSGYVDEQLIHEAPCGTGLNDLRVLTDEVAKSIS